MLKKELDCLNKANEGIAWRIDNTKLVLDQAVESTRQQTQHDSSTLTAIKESIAKIERTITDTKVHNAVMRRLNFNEMHSRKFNITDANHHTFHWLLDSHDDRSNDTNFDSPGVDGQLKADISFSVEESSLHHFHPQSHWQDHEKKQKQTRELFLHWLQSDNGLFYISGKPGSGKSTLLKFICSEKKTIKELETWAGEKRLIFVQLFFWAAGSEKQRSLEGLYRSILWEALCACPEIGVDLFPEHWLSYKLDATGRLDDNDCPIPLAELRDAFERLVTSRKILQRHRICIFVDGLDEYEGNNHWDIAKSLAAWSQNPDVKICVGCRPLNEFEHHFGRNNIRKIRLHEHTWYDMIGFIRDRLFGDERFDAFRNQDEYLSIQYELVQRAEGVFLWLELAIKDLLDGLGSAYSLPQLKAKLAAIPDAIENIYKKLLGSISSSDRRLTSRTFLALLELQNKTWTSSSRSDIIFSFLDDIADKELDDSELYRGDLDPFLTDNEMDKRRQAIRLRINKRCKGLIQMSPGGWFHKSQVLEPIHRTLFEYLTQSETMLWLRGGAVNFNPHLSLLLCHLQLSRVILIGAAYHKREIFEPEECLRDAYRLSRMILFLSNQIWDAMETIYDHTLFIRLVTTIGDIIGGHSPSFRILRNSDCIVPTTPGVWRRSQFSGIFSSHDDCYERSFSSLAFGSTTSDKWGTIFSQTKYGSPTATTNLLLIASASVSQTMGWNETLARRSMALLSFLLQQKLNPNAELPGEPICVHDLFNAYHGHGDFWTSWTAALFSAVSLVYQTEPNIYLVEILKSFITCGADPTVALVGYLLEDPRVKNLEVLQPLPREADYTGPFYIDVFQLLRLWKLDDIESLATLTAASGGRIVSTWLSKIKSSLEIWNTKPDFGIKRLATDELRTKTFVVLNVVPVERLSDINIPDLDRLLVDLKHGGRVAFVNMV